jgi:PAS domain S-box-containing protein
MTSELRAARLRSEAESERIVRANEDLERGREFLEQAQTSAHLGSWDWDIGNNHVTWSDEMFRLYGYEPGSIVVTYETFLRSVHPDDREMVVRSIQDTLRTHIPFAFDHRIVRPDGTTRWLHGRGRVVVDAAGQPACMVGSGQDITEIRRVAETERRLADAARNAEARAQQANRAKTQFLAAMSHELRTPLNVIIGCSELLEIGIHGPLSSEQREILGRMQRSQRHLQALIEDLLGFAKLEVGRLEFRLVDVRLHALFVTLDETLRPQLDKKRLLYGYHGCNPDLTVRADPSRLEQIAINLLMNAVKFTRDGGEISVAVKVAGDAVAISVTDTGVGIPADKLELIFEPFVQLADGMSDRASGAGLGLAICRELARAMGGEITVTSTPGIGSTFTLRLPRGPDVVPDTTTASSPHEAALEPPA